MKNWEVEAILKFYKDIDLDIKVTGEWLEQYESVYDTTGAINYDGMEVLTWQDRKTKTGKRRSNFFWIQTA